MKNIVINSLMVFAVLSSGLALQAQDKAKKSPEERAEKMTAFMAEKLELSTEQTEAVSKVNTEMAIEMQAAMKNHKGDREAMKSEMQKIGKSHSAAMKTILDDEQFRKYEAMKERKKRNWKNKHGHRSGTDHQTDRPERQQNRLRK